MAGLGRAAAAHHFAGHFGWKHIHWPAQNGNGHERVGTHGVDVADGIGSGNTPEVERIVHDGHEKVGGGNHAALVVQRIHSRIIARCVADPQAWIQVLGFVLGAVAGVAVALGL